MIFLLLSVMFISLFNVLNNGHFYLTLSNDDSLVSFSFMFVQFESGRVKDDGVLGR